MELHLKLTGLFLILLSLLHGIFPAYFKWQTELRFISLINRQLMYIHTFFIALALFLLGVLCLTSAKEIIETSLGKKLALGTGIFWMIRLLIQFFGYSSQLWKGKRFETGVHIFFTFLWSYFACVFIWVYLA